ncbi:retrotransposon protein, putative, ty1-copia subclass [Tanacetum coccineum]
MVRSMMSQTTLPKSFWDMHLETASAFSKSVFQLRVGKDTIRKQSPYGPNAEFFENSLRDQEASGSLEDLEIIQEEELILDLPPNGKTVGSKWLFKKTADMDGVVHTYNARLVAKGFTQTYRVDYEETFSPVADISAIRILIAITAFYDYEIWQMDVKTTFLNGHLSEEVYMVQPKGFVNPKYLNRVCNLKRSIYGLKQASRQWNKRFDDEIKKFGFTQNCDEPCVYLKASGTNVTFLILCFAMKDLGEAAYILGIKIYRDRSRRLIGLCQSAYIEKILKRFHMEISKRGSIPMQEKLRLSKRQGASTLVELKRMQNVPYASAVGDLHWTTVKNILKYLRNTKDMFLVYGVHYLREVIEYGDIKLEKVHTDDNLADPFTKALAFPKHSEHTKNIGMLPAIEHLRRLDVGSPVNDDQHSAAVVSSIISNILSMDFDGCDDDSIFPQTVAGLYEGKNQ